MTVRIYSWIFITFGTTFLLLINMIGTAKRQKTLFEFAGKDKHGGLGEKECESGNASDTLRCRSGPSSVENSEDGNKSRKFQTKWKTLYSWLELKNDKMFCQVCIHANKKNSFTTGCSNMKTSALKEHVETSSHKDAIQVPLLQKNVDKLNKKQVSEEDRALEVAMKTTLWLVKENIPLVKFKSLVGLLRTLKCPDIDKLQVRDHINYDSDYAVREFLKSMNFVIEEETKEKLAASPFVTVLADESTDITVHKKLMLYAQVTDRNMRAETRFITNVNLKEGTGKAITDAIFSEFQKRGVDAKKIMGLGSDGAKVMTGTNMGVTGLMLRNNPHLVNVHCVAHRLALCTSQAAEGIPAIQKFSQTVGDIADYFRGSSNRMERLADVHDILGSHYLTYRELHSVRWLSLHNCIEVIYRTLDPLLTYLSDINISKDPKANGLKKKVACMKFVTLIYAMMDILQIISTLSMFFQTENVDLALVKVKLGMCRSDLKKLQDTDGLFLQELKDEMQGLLFKGHELAGCSDVELASARKKYIVKILDNLSDRFQDQDILAEFAVLGMRPLTFLSKDDLPDWGNVEIEALIERYGNSRKHTWKEGGTVHVKESDPVIDKAETMNEWREVKQVVLAEMYDRSTITTLWQQIVAYHRDKFPNVEKLVHLALTCPIHTAGCERGFSAQNQIITALRNRLLPDTADMILRLRVHGKSLEDFDYDRAADDFKKSVPRALFGYKQLQ